MIVDIDVVIGTIWRTGCLIYSQKDILFVLFFDIGDVFAPFYIIMTS